MNIFDVKAENEDIVFRRIEVFLARKLKKRYPELADLHLDTSFVKDEKTIVTISKTHYQSTEPLKRKAKKDPAKSPLWHKNSAFGVLCLVVLILLWYILFSNS